MSTAFDIRTAIAAQLRASIRGLQAQPYVMANPSPPSADVRRGQVDYHQSMTEDGITHWTMLIRVYVASSTDKGAQYNLDSYLSPSGDRSVKAAVESDRTLGGTVSDVIVTTATGEQTYSVEGQAPLIGSEWTVEVWL